MFYTFASSKHQLAPSQESGLDKDKEHLEIPQRKRRKVQRACDHCRLHRVRCDNQVPCSRCMRDKIACTASNSDTDRDFESISKQLKVLEARLQRYKDVKSQPISPLEEVSSETPTALRPLAMRQELERPSDLLSSRDYSATDSPLTFTAKIAAFFSVSATMVYQAPLDDQFSYISPISTYETASLDLSVPPVTILSESQISCLLGVFWTSHHPHFPILDEEEFMAHLKSLWKEGETGSKESPLVDAVTALCIQYVHSSHSINDILGLKAVRLSYNGDVSLTGFCYMRRCRAALDTSATIANPSLTTVKCYIFMTIYLLNAGQYQTAYNMIGLAVRIAHGIGLHQKPTQLQSPKKLELWKRTWWVLVQLDLKSSRELGKPVAIQYSTITCPFPSGTCVGESLADAGGLEYHINSIKMASTILSITEQINYRNLRHPGDDISALDLRGEVLNEELEPLRKWKENMKTTKDFSALRLDVDQPARRDHYSPPWLQRQRICLELQYHHNLLVLCRPFICFQNNASSEPNRRSFKADTHATTCLQSSLTSIQIIHTAFSDTNILQGWLEIYQLQWVAVLTLVGFILAYPTCPYRPIARETMDKALEVFERAANEYSVAARAAKLTRSMCSRIDKLLESIKSASSDAQPSGFANEIRNDSSSKVSKSNSDPYTEELFFTPTIRNSEQYDGEMSSWMPRMDTALEISYLNELDDLFADLAEFPLIGMEYGETMP